MYAFDVLQYLFLLKFLIGIDPIFSTRKDLDAIIINTDYSKCLICQKNDSKEGSSELTARGLVTFRKVVFDRKEELYNRIHDDLDNEQFIISKKPLYHRSCQNKYVYSKLLNVGTPNVNEGPSTGKKRKAIDFKEVCFVCDTVSYPFSRGKRL